MAVYPCEPSFLGKCFDTSASELGRSLIEAWLRVRCRCASATRHPEALEASPEGIKRARSPNSTTYLTHFTQQTQSTDLQHTQTFKTTNEHISAIMSDQMQTIELTQPTRANESMVAQQSTTANTQQVSFPTQHYLPIQLSILQESQFQSQAIFLTHLKQQSTESQAETRAPRLWMRGGGLCGTYLPSTPFPTQSVDVF